MPRKKAKTMTCTCPSKSMLIIGGVVSIILGLCLWFGCLTLDKTIAIILVLAGLAKMCHSGKH